MVHGAAEVAIVVDFDHWSRWWSQQCQRFLIPPRDTRGFLAEVTHRKCYGEQKRNKFNEAMWKITGKCVFLMLFRKGSGSVFPQELTGWKFTDFPTIVPKSIICRCSSSTNCGGVSVNLMDLRPKKMQHVDPLVDSKNPMPPMVQHIWGNWFHNSQTSSASNMENLFPNMIPMGLRYCPLKHHLYQNLPKNKRRCSALLFEWCNY